MFGFKAKWETKMFQNEEWCLPSSRALQPSPSCDFLDVVFCRSRSILYIFSTTGDLFFFKGIFKDNYIRLLFLMMRTNGLVKWATKMPLSVYPNHLPFYISFYKSNKHWFFRVLNSKSSIFGDSDLTYMKAGKQNWVAIINTKETM